MGIIDYHSPLNALISVKGYTYKRDSVAAILKSFEGIRHTFLEKPASQAFMLSPKRWTIARRVGDALHLIILILLLGSIEFVMADCPDQLASDLGNPYLYTETEWSPEVEWVTATFSLTNESGREINFTTLAPSETLDAWVRYPDGSDPYSTPPYEISDEDFIYRQSPAGSSFSAGAVISWKVAMYVAGAPEDYRRELKVSPTEAGDAFSELEPNLISSSLSCSSGEPFLAEITTIEAGLDEIILSVLAETGRSAISSYHASCENSAGISTVASSASNSLTLSNLDAGEEYSCTATAINSWGASASSDPKRASTPGNHLPAWLLHEASTP